MKALYLVPFLLLALPSCDSASADHHAEAGKPGDVSTAVIQILPSTPVPRTENFIANEIASLTMGVVLNKALRDNQWDEKKVEIKDLLNALKVEHLEGTDMARLTVTGRKKIKGKAIIDGLIRSYIELRTELEMDRGMQQLRAFDDELVAQSDLVQDLRKQLVVVVQQYGIPYLENQPNSPGQAEIASHTKVHEKLQELRLEEALLKAQLSDLDKDSEQFAPLTKKLEINLRQSKTVEELTAKLKGEGIELSLKQEFYQRTKDNYENALALLNEMKRKVQESRFAIKMPITPVIIREEPH